MQCFIQLWVTDPMDQTSGKKNVTLITKTPSILSNKAVKHYNNMAKASNEYTIKLMPNIEYYRVIDFIEQVCGLSYSLWNMYALFVTDLCCVKPD